MSLATTIARALACIRAVASVENVYAAPLTKTIRSTAEAARNVSTGESVQSWELTFAPSPRQRGVSGYRETELEIEIVAHYKHSENADGDDPTMVAFLVLLDAVGNALVDPATGFPQATEEGVSMTERPGFPVKLPTGQSALRARLRLVLWDTSST